MLEESIRVPAHPERQVNTSLLGVSSLEHVSRAPVTDKPRQGPAWKLRLIEINCSAWNQSRFLCTSQKGPRSITAFVFLLKPQELLEKVHRLLTVSDFRSGRKKTKQNSSLGREQSVHQRNLCLSLPSQVQDICYLLQAVDPKH